VAVERGCWFDLEAGEEAAEFIEGFCRHSKGELSGKAFVLSWWQRWRIVYPIFGWKRGDGTRRFRRAYIEVARKNGKSTLAAAIGILLMIGDGEMGASVISAAADRPQARKVFDEARNMALQCPDLRAMVKVYRSAIAWLETFSIFEVVSADAFRKFGENNSGVIFDELHAQRTPALWKTLTTGTGSRRQPLVFEITTSGESLLSICREEHDYAVGVLSGAIEDETFFGYIRAADAEDEWWRLETWIKANPELGMDDWIEVGRRGKVRLNDRCPWNPPDQNRGKAGGDAGDTGDVLYAETYVRDFAEWVRKNPGLVPRGAVNLETFVGECLEGFYATSALARFLWLRLNLWSQSEVKWMPPEVWARCRGRWDAGSRNIWEELKGRRCYAGLDMSSRLDLTALGLLFPPIEEGERWKILMRYWVPKEGAARRAMADRVPYLEWIRDGWIEATAGNEVDYDVVRKAIVGLGQEYEILEIRMDKWNSAQIGQELAAEGLKVVMVPPQMQFMSGPTKEMEAMVIGRRLEHGGHPVLAWNADNVVMTINADEDMRPNKGKSRERIDGIVALVQATGGSIAGAAVGARSKYEDEEAVIV
jgi:phage terminase large subunit-like protein